MTREEQIDQECRKRRDIKFNVQVLPEDPHWRLYSDEAHLQVTYNGYHWQSINLTKREAKLVVGALVKHFGLEFG